MNEAGQKSENAGIRVIGLITRMLAVIGTILLFSMMVLTFVDVWGRYVFNYPIPGGFEITELMMATLIFAGFPLITQHEEHITVDLFDRFVPKALVRWQNVLIGLLCTVMVATLSYRMWLRAAEQLAYGDRTAALYIPVAPITYFMAVTMALTCILLLLLTWAKFTNRHHPS